MHLTATGKFVIFAVPEQCELEVCLMKKLFVICIALVIAVSAGCGNKPDSARESAVTETETVKQIYICDPVDGSEIKPAVEGKYSYVYKEVKYRFNSEKNYEAFLEDPEKYVSK